ncbi:PLP-dependent aminotransferase family protein [Algicella marina]|uniref:Aminotransferase class I/II-fold pyridoxal phosphate-dependent enzyme n=1 Tax=Algicella marina TaxID=2683284 RepID=A0A6P1SV71_9RHOB|nr:PLP-dependent aminotransferase family protein [Algicella marina]QHQ34348.1 aminotransferase class I/II-fold pyridoxal phosphate-dependent enzyme [Algicella marina]
MLNWAPPTDRSGKPRYLELADAIARDVTAGRLRPGDRLPPQRKLAERLGVDFTTVSRGYAEARARGLVESHVGRGTFISDASARIQTRELRRSGDRDLTMNLPPEPTDPDLLRRMREGLETVAVNMVDLLRYQSSTGGQVDKEAASSWLSLRGMVPTLDRVAITPGAHPTIMAILMLLTEPGDCILSEGVSYSGTRGIAARLRLQQVGLAEDDEGILPDALEAAIAAHRPKLLYLNPTLNNPTTRTVSLARRQAIAEILLAHDLPLIEDDAYGFIPPHPPAPIASMAPGLTWHIGGLAKCIGAGLRLAYTVAPSARLARDLAQCLKSISVMPSPVSMALATRWIEDGTADQIRRFVRTETSERQKIAARVFEGFTFAADPHAFNIWLTLPEGRSRADVVGRMAGASIGIMPSDVFTILGTPTEALRVCLGGEIDRPRLEDGLGQLAHILQSDY